MWEIAEDRCSFETSRSIKPVPANIKKCNSVDEVYYIFCFYSFVVYVLIIYLGFGGIEKFSTSHGTIDFITSSTKKYINE